MTLAVRDMTGGGPRVARTSPGRPDQEVRVTHLDLTDPASVTAFTTAWEGPLHVLVNNAGVMACP